MEEIDTKGAGKVENNAERVMQLLYSCLYRDEEVEGGRPKDGMPEPVKVEGIVTNYGFHPGRLEAAKPELQKIIKEVVQDSFYTDTGGGYTTLELCRDRNGEMWCEHKTMEALVCMSIGLKLAKWCLPREMWKMMPGAMPYICFNRP